MQTVQIKTTDIEPVTNSKINSISCRVTLIYQNTDTIHRVDNKRILDEYPSIESNVSNDL